MSSSWKKFEIIEKIFSRVFRLDTKIAIFPCKPVENVEKKFFFKVNF